MKSHVKVWIGIGTLAVALVAAGPGLAAEKASPQEVMDKVNEAAVFLAQAGTPGLAEFNKADGPWVWKDTYLVIEDCAAGKVATHPFKAKIIGMPLDKMVDIKGNAFGIGACEAANAPQGGWYEYWFPKPGEKVPSRKISFNRKVEGSGLIVIGGIYDDNLTVDALTKMIH